MMTHSEDIYIVSGVRTAIGDFGGALKQYRPADLGSKVITEAINRAGVTPADVEHVVMGQVMPTGPKDQSRARVAALNADTPVEAPALTVNRLCGSGVQSIISCAQMMKLGEASITVAGGAESMTNVPYHDLEARWGKKLGNSILLDALVEGLTDPIHGIHMAITAENVAERYQVTRQEQDDLAVEGHHRAARAIAEGRFSEQILPVEIKTRKGTVFFYDVQGRGLGHGRQRQRDQRRRPRVRPRHGQRGAQAGPHADGAGRRLGPCRGRARIYGCRPGQGRADRPQARRSDARRHGRDRGQ